MARQRLPDQCKRANVEVFVDTAICGGNAIAQPAGRSEPHRQIDTLRIDIFTMCICKLSRAPALKFLRQFPVRIVEKWPIEKAPIAHLPLSHSGEREGPAR